MRVKEESPSREIESKEKAQSLEQERLASVSEHSAVRIKHL